MSEGFELGPFHVPQQSRRDKLRSLEGLHPALYDPMITDAVLHHHRPPTPPPPPPPFLALPPPVKQEGRLNLMGFPPAGDRADHHLPHFLLASSTTTSSSSSHHHLVDLPPSLAANPSSSYICPGQAFEQPLLGSSNRLLYKQSFPVATTHQGLSLSLSSQTFNPDASSAPPPAMDNYIVIGGDPSRSIGPLGPFTGYSEVLKGSRFLKPAQQLLEEFCDVGQRAYYLENISPPDVDMDMADHSTGVGSSGGDHGEYSRRKTRLVSMLNEVCKGYRHYYQQMQAVMASFESVHGLSKVAPFTPLALKALSKHFRNLKNAIATQLRSCKNGVEDSSNKDDEPHFNLSDQHLEHQRVAHATAVYEQPHVWRPQRGLPERAVAVLRAWLFEHFLHPYPTDTDKHMLAKQTGLSRNQVSNWFINARVRLWKPMVEEIHSLEVRQAQKAPECSRDQDVNKQGNTSNTLSLPTNEHTYVENQQAANELAAIPKYTAAQTINFSYDNHQMEVAPIGHHVVAGGAGAGSGVSLTLGLHQGNGACLPEHYPLGVAHFGLGGIGGSSASYGGFGGFSGQIRHFDGRLLHDFVG